MQIYGGLCGSYAAAQSENSEIDPFAATAPTNETMMNWTLWRPLDGKGLTDVAAGVRLGEMVWKRWPKPFTIGTF